jgi:hypothetical protein
LFTLSAPAVDDGLVLIKYDRELKELLTHCKKIVTKLHFRGDLVETEMLKTYTTDTVSQLLSQIGEAYEIASCDCTIPVLEIEIEDNSPQADSGMSTTTTNVTKAFHRLQQEVVTRWNSALEMINSLLSLKNEVQEALKRTGNFDLLLKPVEWNTLNQLSQFLALFKSLTEICSGNSVGLSVVPLIRAKVAAACAISDSDCDELALLKRKILARLDARFPLNSFIIIATLLDPASKNKKYLNMTLDDKRNLLIAAIQKAQMGAVITVGFDRSTSAAAPGSDSTDMVSTSGAEHLSLDYQSQEESSVSKPKKLKVMDEFEDEDSDGGVFATVTQYLSSNEKPTDEERADPLLFWRNSKYTVLASLARTYLTASASSVPCEAMFSITGMMLNGRRSSLAPHTFNRLIFLHDNGPLAAIGKKDDNVD